MPAAMPTKNPRKVSQGLVPSQPSADLQDLADSCVIEFDEFRQPADEVSVRAVIGQQWQAVGYDADGREVDLLADWLAGSMV